jgi:hypothetical protein
MRYGFVAILAIVLLSAACGTQPPVTAQPTEAIPQVPLPTIDEQGLVAGRLTCGNGGTFPAAALEGPGSAQLGNDAAAAGLRAVIAESGDPQVPDTGWHLVSVSATQAQYVAQNRGDSGWSVVALERGPSGWTMDLVGACRLQFVLGPGISVARWWLDPAAAEPGAGAGVGATTVAALVDEECGGPLDGRVVAPVIIYSPDAVVLVFGVARAAVTGGQDSICMQSPPVAYRAVLTEPLAGRLLLDGGVVPPRDATSPPD